MASVLREIRLLEPKLLGKHEELKNINLIVDISHQLGLSGGLTGGFSGWQLGADFGKEKSISQPNHIPISTLESYFQSLVQFIRDHSIQGKKFEGLIVHVNNFDVVLENIDNKKVVVNFFNEIRDILQMKHVYYLFLGPKSFYKDIISKKQRVKSIFFQTPLSVEPLNKTEIIEAFKERMEILKSEDVVNYIEPFENEVIYQIYDLYDGDIRSIMSALKDILISHSDRLSQTLSKDEAMLLLGRERWERIAIQLKDKAKEALIFFIQSGKFLSQKDLMKEFSQAQSNISGYYLKPLKEQNIIEEKSRKNKMIYWGLTKQYEPLRYIQRSKQAISDKMGKGQIPLFLR